MCNKMPSSAMLCKNNERGMRECDKDWKAKSEIQSTWEKIYFLLYKPDDSIYTSIMKFRYIEDYEKMKKINIKLWQIERIIGTIDTACLYSKKNLILFMKWKKKQKNCWNW